MADVKKDEKPPESVEVDVKGLAEALQPAINDAVVKAADADAARRAQAARQQVQARQRQAQAPGNGKGDALAEVIAPYIQPALAAVAGHSAVASANAVDYAKFYTDHPEARTHQDKIEAKFSQLLAEGQPLARGDIWNWLRGADFDAFRKEANDAEKVALDRAKTEGLAATPGAHAGHVVISGDPFTMSAEELESVLKEVVV